LTQFDNSRFDYILPVERRAILGIFPQVAKLKRALDFFGQVNSQLRFELVEL
jgi:hypothetical protein